MATVHAADEQATRELTQLERTRQAALIAVDVDVLDRIFDASLVHVHAPGVVNDKAQLIEHTRTRRPYLEITRGPLSMRLVGDVAVVTGEITNRMRAAGGGERVLTGMATQVAMRGDDGAWRYLSFQMSPYGPREWGRLPSEEDAR